MDTYLMSKRSAYRVGMLLLMVSTAVAGSGQSTVRTCVARLDGAPVYHWRGFTSRLPDDVDRALVLREFFRKGFNLPSKLVDDGLRQEITEHYAGDEHRFAGGLRQQGATLKDYRQFLTEEITISSMLYQSARAHPHDEQAKWLASLRRGARIEKLPVDNTNS